MVALCWRGGQWWWHSGDWVVFAIGLLGFWWGFSFLLFFLKFGFLVLVGFWWAMGSDGVVASGGGD